MSTSSAKKVSLPFGGLYPDLLFLAFLDFLVFFCFSRNSLLFRVFFPSFLRILGVRKRSQRSEHSYFKIRSCTVRSDLKNKHEINRKCLIFKIRSYSARSDLKNKSARFSGMENPCFFGGFPFPEKARKRRSG